MPSDFSVRSDVLVHWTGKDIDAKFDPKWHEADKPTMPVRAVTAYVDRLRDILRHGLWMTEQAEWQMFDVTVPAVACTCFTELKLSQSRSHARQYGRLGIAVKRPFVFNRDGRPMVYFEPRFKQDGLLAHLVEDVKDRRVLQFFKPMNADAKGRMRYDFYSESEWRIVAGSGSRFLRSIQDTNVTGGEFERYWGELDPTVRGKLKFLIPLDGWHAGLIYPSIEVKNVAQSDLEIRTLISEVAARGPSVGVEGRNLPFEIDLDMCMNF